MTPPRPVMPCPVCGSPMNCHAEKLVQRVDEDTVDDDALEGSVEEIYVCPSCFVTATRPARPR